MIVYEAIRTKRAVRDFAAKPIPEDVIRQILNAGRLSQSAKNLQPWQFIAIQERTRLQQLAERGKFSPFLGEAALGIVIVTPDPTERFQILFDAGQSAAYMQLAGWELGVGSCLTTSYDREGVRALLGIPAGWHAYIAIGFGYPQPDGPKRRSSRPGRKPFDEIVHWEQW